MHQAFFPTEYRRCRPTYMFYYLPVGLTLTIHPYTILVGMTSFLKDYYCMSDRLVCDSRVCIIASRTTRRRTPRQAPTSSISLRFIQIRVGCRRLRSPTLSSASPNSLCRAYLSHENTCQTRSKLGYTRAWRRLDLNIIFPILHHRCHRFLYLISSETNSW